MHKALRSLLKFHGAKGLWKGLGPTLLRDVPFSGNLILFIYVEGFFYFPNIEVLHLQ